MPAYRLATLGPVRASTFDMDRSKNIQLIALGRADEDTVALLQSSRMASFPARNHLAVYSLRFAPLPKVKIRTTCGLFTCLFLILRALQLSLYFELVLA